MYTELSAAVTKYDQKQLRLSLKNRKRFYNIHALRLSLEAVERACAAYYKDGCTRQAVVENFCGQLLDVCLAALGLDKSTDAEQRMTW